MTRLTVRRPARLALFTIPVLAALAVAGAAFLAGGGPALAQEKKPAAAPASKSKSGTGKSAPGKSGAAKPDAAKADPAKPKGAAAAKPDPAKPAAPKPAATGKPAAGKTTAAAAVPAPPPLPADDKLILPFVGENTFLVARFDPGLVDVDQIEQFALQVTEADAAAAKADAATLAAAKAKATEDAKKIRASLDRFRAAGGHQVYVLADVTDVTTGSNLMFVVPLRTGADVAKLTAMIVEISPPDIKHVREQVGQALVVGSQAQVDRMKALTSGNAGAGAPADSAMQADLTSAMAAAGEAPVRVALVPGEGAWLLAEQALAGFAAPAGVDPTVITRGVRWATLAVSQKPTFGMVVTVRATDAAQATALVSLMNNRMAQAGVPGAAAAAMKELVKHEGDTITITLPAQQLLPGLMAARRQANAIAAQREAQRGPAVPEGDGLD
jgi:hypothetical protein